MKGDLKDVMENYESSYFPKTTLPTTNLLFILHYITDQFSSRRAYSINCVLIWVRNLTIERIWPEVNSRVNYPIKRVLVGLEENGILDMTNEHVQFCVSWFTCKVAEVGMKIFVDSWNFHKIKGKKSILGINSRNYIKAKSHMGHVAASQNQHATTSLSRSTRNF